jgi:hypothetical protein
MATLKFGIPTYFLFKKIYIYRPFKRNPRDHRKKKKNSKQKKICLKDSINLHALMGFDGGRSLGCLGGYPSTI